MRRIFPVDKRKYFDEDKFATIQFSGRSMSSGYMSPTSYGYSSPTIGFTTFKEYKIKNIVLTTNRIVQKSITLRTSDGVNLYTFDVDDYKKIIRPDFLIKIPKNATLNLFINGSGISGDINITLDLEANNI